MKRQIIKCVSVTVIAMMLSPSFVFADGASNVSTLQGVKGDAIVLAEADKTNDAEAVKENPGSASEGAGAGAQAATTAAAGAISVTGVLIAIGVVGLIAAVSSGGGGGNQSGTTGTVSP